MLRRYRHTMTRARKSPVLCWRGSYRAVALEDAPARPPFARTLALRAVAAVRVWGSAGLHLDYSTELGGRKSPAGEGGAVISLT